MTRRRPISSKRNVLTRLDATEDAPFEVPDAQEARDVVRVMVGEGKR